MVQIKVVKFCCTTVMADLASHRNDNNFLVHCSFNFDGRFCQ